MPTREEVLAGANEQLNEWAAAYVMGWKETEIFGITTPEPTPVYKLHDRKVLYSTPYKFGLSSTEYDHQYYDYQPATDIAQAMGLLLHLRETRAMEWHIDTSYQTHTHIARIYYEASANGTHFVEEETVSLMVAITRAALLAVIAAEEL